MCVWGGVNNGELVVRLARGRQHSGLPCVGMGTSKRQLVIMVFVKRTQICRACQLEAPVNVLFTRGGSFQQTKLPHVERSLERSNATHSWPR